MQMGEPWRVTRKTLHQLFMESKCENEHISLQNAEAIQMLRDICNTPEDLMLHPKRYSNSIIVSLRKSCFPRYMMNKLRDMETQSMAFEHQA